MKNTQILLILSLFISLAACNKSDENTNAKNSDNIAQAKTHPSDPKPQTITQKEVSRIALLEAKQLLTGTEKDKNLDVTNASKTYAEAEKLYNDGEFKKAQITAVDVRHQLEALIIKNLK
ncbi:MAG: hypothetical protein JKX98_08470 [Alcanivoracaceae bacterium]|nr:hypothetical protein [Alcanivoracaceae bacterium]